MKKLIYRLFVILIILLSSLIAILSTIGIETNKFNKLISSKISQTKNINLKLKTIKFKIDPKKLDLFLETRNPEIIYRSVSVPVKNINVYINFLSLLKSDPKIEKISFNLKELDIKQLKKLSIMIKPSNFKSLINNRVKEGQLISEIEIFLTDKGTLKNFIAKGNVKHLNVKLFDNLNFKKTNFSFFADKNDILIQKIFGDIEDIKISDGDIKLNIENGIKLNSNFRSKINFNKENYHKFAKVLDNYKLAKKIESLKADFNNNLSIDLDNTYKVKDYKYSISGKIEKGKYKFLNPLKNNLITEEIKEIYLKDVNIKTILNLNDISLSGEGKYSFNNSSFLKINFANNLNNNLLKLKLNLDYENILELPLINYRKSKDSVANLFLDLEKKRDEININKFNFEEGENLIQINNLRFRENSVLSFKKVAVATTNNNFSIQNNKKIIIKGTKFDATNLAKFFNKQSDKNIFEKINSKIEIDFKNIKVPMSEKLENFKLIGEIKKGQFIKISSKGDFGGNNFLDISMKKDKNSDKKYLEIYSDLTRPLLSEYNFFKGLSGGNLLFTSVIEDKKSITKIKIENFKIVNAPGVIKLLSLADLGGLVDLAEGEGLSFDVLEINMEKSNNFLKLNEILALGPSMSVLMEGYQDKSGLTSLRGTLVPAKTLNKIISKIPVIGKIVIPKEVGEGLFGISFKMKGPKGKIKTSINPIRTLTPRFIQKIAERNKEAK